MAESVVIRPAVARRFGTFIRHGRVLFFSAPCSFGKSLLANTLLGGRRALRLQAGTPEAVLPPQEADWDILLIDDFQLQQDDRELQALCALIRESPDRRFILLSRGAPPGCMMAFQYAGLMTVLEADDLLFDREDARRLFRLFETPVTDSDLDAILHESIGYPLGLAVFDAGHEHALRARHRLRGL